jgi:hypothetical protein
MIKLKSLLEDVELNFANSAAIPAGARGNEDAITIALGIYLDKVIRKDLSEQKKEIIINLDDIIKNFTKGKDTNQAVVRRAITNMVNKIKDGFAELPDKAKIETNKGVYNLEKDGNKIKISLAPGDSKFKVFDPLGDFIKQAGGGDTGLGKVIGEDDVDESLRNWFKKEKWVRIDTQGNIAGKCGTMPKGKATQRCLPAAKARSLTKAQRRATARKKVRGSRKGKQFVRNTKKARVKLKK